MTWFIVMFAKCNWNQKQLVDLKLMKDGFEIDSLTVSCRNCAWGITFNATKDSSLKAVSSEHLRCPKTATAPLGATTAEQSQISRERPANLCRFPMSFNPPQFLLYLLEGGFAVNSRNDASFRCNLLLCQCASKCLICICWKPRWGRKAWRHVASVPTTRLSAHQFLLLFLFSMSALLPTHWFLKAKSTCQSVYL